MKKRIIVTVVCIALLLSVIGVAVSAAILSTSQAPLTSDDIRFLRGYAGDKGEWSISGNKINLNGSGVVSSAQKIVWNPATINSGTSYILFTVTYNQAYTNVGDNFADYRFAAGLMDSQSFQGMAEGEGIGFEYRLNSRSGGIQARTFYYDGASDLSMKYPERNNGLGGLIANENVSIQCKLTYNEAAGKWKLWTDKNGDGAVDTELGTCDPNSDWEKNNGSAQYFPTDLISKGEGYLVFGSYGATNMNMTFELDGVGGGFSFTDNVTYNDTVERVGENIALEDNILTRFYVKYSSYDMYAKANVTLACGDNTVTYSGSNKGIEVDTLTYAYTIPVPAALGNTAINITVAPHADSTATWTGDTTYSTTVMDYCTALKAQTTGTDEKSVALRELCDSIADYCNKAKAYFDLAD